MRKLFFLSAALAVSSTACGGGGGGGSSPAPAPTPTATAPSQTLPQSGGTIPASGPPTAVGTSGYAVLITLAAISAGQPASGSVFYSTDNTFTGLPGAPPNAPVLPSSFGTALVYTDIRVSTANGSGVTFAAQPGFNFTLPSPGGGTYSLAEYDTTQPGYRTIAGPANLLDPTHVRLFGPNPGSQTTLTLNQDYTYVLYH